MNDFLDKVIDLPVAARAGILAGIGALILVVYVFVIYQPVGEELTLVTGEVETLELDVVEKNGIVANLPKYREEVKRLDVELTKALRELPDRKGIEQLLSRISDKARDAGLDIRLFKPLPEQLRDFYAEVPVEIAVRGTFHQVATFFDEVGHLARIVNVNRFNMGSPKLQANDFILDTVAVATSFRFLEEKERLSPKKGKKGRKKRGKKA